MSCPLLQLSSTPGASPPHFQRGKPALLPFSELLGGTKALKAGRCQAGTQEKDGRVVTKPFPVLEKCSEHG